jgi:hypothetical protein
MTPPDNISNRTLAGVAAALGIAIGVAPQALLAQATSGTPGAPAAVQDKPWITQHKVVIQKDAIQHKAVLGTGVGSVPAVQDNAVLSTGTGSVPAVQGKFKVYQQKMKVPTNQLKTTTGVPANQVKSDLPAVQGKTTVPAVQMKVKTQATQ